MLKETKARLRKLEHRVRDQWLYEAHNIQTGDEITVIETYKDGKLVERFIEGYGLPIPTQHFEEIIMNNVSKVAVQFKYNTKEYIYNTTHEHAVGDMVVVDSPQDGLVVVAVSRLEITREEASRGTKWIVACVAMEEHEQRIANDFRMAELKNTIEQKVRKAQARELITKHIGEDDADLKELEALERGELNYNANELIGEVV